MNEHFFETKQVPLYIHSKPHETLFAIVDWIDYEMVMEHKWYLDQRKTNNYAKTFPYIGNQKNRTLYLHRFVTYEPHYDIDHIDGNGLNCSHVNLRACNHSQNAGNAKKRPGTIGIYKGVILDKRDGSWVARITVDGKYYHCGTYKTPLEAALAYDKKARELRGNWAKTNF